MLVLMKKRRQSMETHKMTYGEKVCSVLAALFLWQLLSLHIHQRILLASPFDVVKALIELLSQSVTYLTIWNTSRHILGGFFIALLLGTFLAGVSKKYRAAEIFLWPYMQVIKTAPVASFIILCLVWFPVQKLSLIISFLMVLPVVYYSVLTGLRSQPAELVETALVNGFTVRGRLVGIVLPSLKQAYTIIFSTGLSMAFKAGVAAEVIGTPGGTIGKMLYTAKIYLETPELMAWTICIIGISMVLEKIFLYLVKFFYEHLEWIA